MLCAVPFASTVRPSVSRNSEPTNSIFTIPDFKAKKAAAADADGRAGLPLKELHFSASQQQPAQTTCHFGPNLVTDE